MHEPVTPQSQDKYSTTEPLRSLKKGAASRPSVKSAYQKSNFLISQPKHMLWVLKRTISMRQFFLAPKTYVQTDGLENIYNFKL